MQLKPSYTLFGFRFAVLGTVNYKLDNDDGGHYVTYLFPSNSELLKIHEIEHKTIRRKPDFDSDTVVIALQKIGKQFDGKEIWIPFNFLIFFRHVIQ